MVGIIAVDPGLTTGIVCGLYNPALRDRTSNWNAVAKSRDITAIQIGPKDPWKGHAPKDAHEGALVVTEYVMSKIGDWHIMRSMGHGEIVVACEHFEVRGVAMGANSKSGLAPVFIAGVLYGTMTGAGWGENLEWIQAGQHMRYATDDRIKRLGKASRGRIGWIRGKPHARDASRIYCYKANKLT
jgi:hypothetical protein